MYTSIRKDAENVSDNQLTLLEKASENLVDINHKNVLDIVSCFADNLGGYSYRALWWKKIKQQAYLLALILNLNQVQLQNKKYLK